MSDFRQCDACGVIGHVRVASSGIGAVSFAYCASCLVNGIEPYGAIVASVWAVGSWADIHPVEQSDYLRIIHFHGKNFEDLKADIAKLDADYMASEARRENDPFYQDHGCCQHCYLVGYDADMCECPTEEVLE